MGRFNQGCMFVYRMYVCIHDTMMHFFGSHIWCKPQSKLIVHIVSSRGKSFCRAFVEQKHDIWTVPKSSYFALLFSSLIGYFVTSNCTAFALAFMIGLSKRVCVKCSSQFLVVHLIFCTSCIFRAGSSSVPVYSVLIAGTDPGEVKWGNFHPPPFLSPFLSFFFFLIPQILK